MTATILIKAVDAARRLGINRSTLHRWVKAGKIECVQIERNSVYFTQEQLDNFIAKHRKRYQPIRLRDNAE